jgi:hypothetical protein
MAIGRSAAQIGLYHPVNSMWVGDEEADRSTTKLGWQLIQHQLDWDYFDEQSLSSVAAIEDGGFKVLSGQVYRAIIIPSSIVISQAAIDRLRAFVKAGGKAIFVGKTPKWVVDRTFLDAKETPDLSFATLIEPVGDITPRVIAALPKPDVKLDGNHPSVTYTHRRWRDGDLYFLLNEGNREESMIAALDGQGQCQEWELRSGEIHPIAAASSAVPLVLEPYEAKVILIGPLPPGVSQAAPSYTAAARLLELSGDWTLG